MSNQQPPDDLAFRLGMLRRQRSRLNSVIKEVSQLQRDFPQTITKLQSLLSDEDEHHLLKEGDSVVSECLDVVELGMALVVIDKMIGIVTSQLPNQHSDFFVPPTHP